MVTITNNTGGMKGFAHVRFPVGASTHSVEALRPIASHPHFRDAVQRGDLTISGEAEGEPDAEAPDVHRGAHAAPLAPETDDEKFERELRELEEAEAEAARKAAEQ